MKKLMTFAAFVMLAAASQAAAVYWTATQVYKGNLTDLSTGVAYFMTTSMSATSAWTSSLTAEDAKALVGSAYNWTPTTAGNYSKLSSAPVANATLGLADATPYTAYLVFFDGATIDDSTSFLVSNTKDFSTMGGTTNIGITFGSQKVASQAAWTTMSVPEPTSGLLLLLGMAGLALKRKVA